MKVYELLDTPEKWTQSVYAMDSRGRVVEPADEAAVCWCLSGALQRCYGETGSTQYALVADRLPLTIPAWNDFMGRTYEDVIALAKDLDI